LQTTSVRPSGVTTSHSYRGPLADKWTRRSGPGQVVDVMAWISFAAAEMPR
jgi:hypothetical protein